MDDSSFSTGVFELPGEPAILINGVPDPDPVADSNAMVIVPAAGDSGNQRNTGFGEWLEGREVQKLFGERYYSGRVTEYDKETGWYRVVYEDGDFEDLEWHELEQVLQPLDITMSLRSLALKIFMKGQESEHGSGRTVVGEKTRGAKSGGRRGRPRGSSSSRSLVS